MADAITLLAIGCGAYFLTRRRRRRLAPAPAPASLLAPEHEPAPEPTRIEAIETLLKQYVTDDPYPNRFYLVQFGDTPESVARAALKHFGDPTPAQVLDYVHCYSGCTHNLDNYGTPSLSRSFSKRLLVPGLGLGLRVAFLPRNADALGLMLGGLAPRMTVDRRTGAPAANSTSYGLLWLPPIDPEAFTQGEVTCSGYEWEDGTSGLEPPPKLFELLEEAA